MPVPGVVQRVAGQSTGQVLPPVGAPARDGPRIAAVVWHGLVKERVVPPKEIDRAVERKKRFEANPPRHTYEED